MDQYKRQISEEVHRRGINIRHIGYLRSLLTFPDLPEPNPDPGQIPGKPHPTGGGEHAGKTTSQTFKKFHPNEEVLLENAKHIFNISDHDFENLKKRHFPTITKDKYYAVLNCTSSDSNDTIKASYRKLVQEFHPDKIANKGLPEEFNQFAITKFQEIQDSYDYVREVRNF